MISDGDSIQAIPVLKRAIILDPGISVPYYYLARCYEQSGNEELSLKYYNLYLKLFTEKETKEREPQTVSTNSVKEDAGKLLSRHREAQDLYMQARQMLLSGDFQNAAHYVQEAIRQYPQEEKYYQLIARICVDMDQPAQALSWYRKACEIIPDDIGLLREYMQLAYKNGFSEEALKTGRKLISLNASGPDVRSVVEELSAQKLNPTVTAKLTVWKRAGSLVLIEHSSDNLNVLMPLKGKPFTVYRKMKPVRNPLTGEVLDWEPAEKVGTVIIDEIRTRVIRATVVDEIKTIGIGDYIPEESIQQ